MPSKISDAINAKSSPFTGSTAAAMNLNYGGYGYMPRLGKVDNGKNVAEWISNAAYVRKNIIPIVISHPKFLEHMPNSSKLIEAFKSLIEQHATVIDGLSSGLKVETDEHPVTGGGEMQEEPTDVKRERSNITMTFREKAGKAISKFLDIYIRYGIGDPDTKVPLVRKYITDLSTIGGIYTPEMYSFTVLFIEPDMTHRDVVDAWLCTNMFFKSNGERTGKRDMYSAGEMVEHSIECASITLNNESVAIMAKSILDSLTILDKIPDTDLVLPEKAIDETVKAAVTGYNAQ